MNTTLDAAGEIAAITMAIITMTVIPYRIIDLILISVRENKYRRWCEHIYNNGNPWYVYTCENGKLYYTRFNYDLEPCTEFKGDYDSCVRWLKRHRYKAVGKCPDYPDYTFAKEEYVEQYTKSGVKFTSYYLLTNEKKIAFYRKEGSMLLLLN